MTESAAFIRELCTRNCALICKKLLSKHATQICTQRRTIVAEDYTLKRLTSRRLVWNPFLTEGRKLAVEDGVLRSSKDLLSAPACRRKQSPPKYTNMAMDEKLESRGAMPAKIRNSCTSTGLYKQNRASHRPCQGTHLRDSKRCELLSSISDLVM
jgi:hypothetical protein